jgi:predicted PurR-regulated permease PerM
MNRVISWLESIRLRQLVTVLLVTIAFLFSTAFGNTYQQSAQAKALTPEAQQYHSEGGEEFQKAVKNTQESGKNIVESAKENIIEKLNLNEPIPPATKEFFQDVKENTQQAVKNPQVIIKGSQNQE